MGVSDAALAEFVKLYKEDFGEEVTEEDASEMSYS